MDDTKITYFSFCCHSQKKNKIRACTFSAEVFWGEEACRVFFFVFLRFFSIGVRPAFCQTGSDFIYLMAKSCSHLCNPRGHTDCADPVWDEARRGLHQGMCMSCRCLSISSLREESSWQTWFRACRQEEAKQIQRGPCIRLRLWSFPQQKTNTSGLISLHLTFSRSDIAKWSLSPAFSQLLLPFLVPPD